MSKIVAVSEKVEHAGTILMWTLAGATEHRALAKAWVAAGLDPAKLPDAPTPATALRRALAEQREQRRLIRPLKGEGFAVVLEHARNDDLDYEILVKCRLDKVGRLCIEDQGHHDDLVTEIRDAFTKHEGELSTEDVSNWIVGLIPELDGVPMRGGGGVYFIPHAHLQRVDLIVGALKKATKHRIYRIPAIHEGDDVTRSDVAQAILDSIEAEAADEAEALEKDLASGKYGSVGLQNRVDHADTVEQKIGRYEELVGTRLEAIRKRLVSLRAGLTVAISKAISEEEKDSGETTASLAAL